MNEGLGELRCRRHFLGKDRFVDDGLGRQRILLQEQGDFCVYKVVHHGAGAAASQLLFGLPFKLRFFQAHADDGGHAFGQFFPGDGWV